MEGKASQSGIVSGPAAAKREVRRMIRERVGGLDAAAREAAFATRNRRIGIIGTAATIRSRSYEKLLRQLVPGAEITARLCRRVSSLVREKNFRRVAVFAARPGEVDLLSLLDLLPDREWYFPLVHEGRRLSFHRVCHHGELVAGSWGIREPGPGCPELHAGEMDLIVLPGAAFTRDGKRLGYGGGFYDTLLAGPAAGVPLAGVCFPCQLLDDLPMEAHDRHVDMVIAPEGE